MSRSSNAGVVSQQVHDLPVYRNGPATPLSASARQSYRDKLRASGQALQLAILDIQRRGRQPHFPHHVSQVAYDFAPSGTLFQEGVTDRRRYKVDNPHVVDHGHDAYPKTESPGGSSATSASSSSGTPSNGTDLMVIAMPQGCDLDTEQIVERLRAAAPTSYED